MLSSCDKCIIAETGCPRNGCCLNCPFFCLNLLKKEAPYLFSEKKTAGLPQAAAKGGYRMSVLLTGAGGFVGSRILQAMPDAAAAPSLRRAEEEDLRRLIDRVRPDWSIHTAAVSDTGACEKDPGASYAANVRLPLLLARAAKGIKLVFFSTDQVYGGLEEPGPDKEDTVRPANTYAAHKLEMERRVLDTAPDAVLLRATWMYDLPLYGMPNRGNFLMNMLSAAARQTEIAFSPAQYRGVTWVREAARLIRDARNLPGGVYNFGSENTLSMYDTALYLSRVTGWRTPIAPPRGIPAQPVDGLRPAARPGHRFFLRGGRPEGLLHRLRPGPGKKRRPVTPPAVQNVTPSNPCHTFLPL